jgi:predicted PurR-regulated permease PerM
MANGVAVELEEDPIEAVAPFLVAFLIAFLFAYNTGRIAARKGRNAVTWGLAGFFLGIVGLAIAYFAPAKQPAA